MSRSKSISLNKKTQDSSVVKIDKSISSRNTMLRTLYFLLLFTFLQALYGSLHDTWVEDLVIDQATVKTSVWLIDVFDSDVGVKPVGSRLHAPGGGINILNGCEGTDVIFLMISAMLVAPLPIRSQLVGAVLGTALVFVANQFRIVVLFYAYRSDKDLFNLLHGTVTPLLLVLVAAVFFVFWLNRNNRPVTTSDANTLGARGAGNPL